MRYLLQNTKVAIVQGIASLILLICPLANAAAETEWVLPAKIEISAGEWPPFLGAELPQNGIVAQLIRDIFAELEIEVEWVFLPWARAMYDTAQGKYAATAVWLFTPERAASFLFSDSVLEEQHVFFHLRSRIFFWQQLSDLQGLRVGGLHGFSYGAEFDQAVSAGIIQTSLVGSSVQNFQRLALRRVDVVAEEISVGYFLLRERLPAIASQITHHPKPLLITQSFLLFPQSQADSPALQQAFNRQLDKFRQSGRYDSYFKIYHLSQLETLVFNHYN